MGYRSDVVLAIAPEAASAFMAMLAANPKAMTLCNNADTFESGYEREGDWLVCWHGIKWYTQVDEYEDIKAIQRFVDALDCNDLSEYGEDECPNDINYKPTQWHEYFKFIQIGEADDDIVSLGSAFEEICIQRSIVY